MAERRPRLRWKRLALLAALLLALWLLLTLHHWLPGPWPGGGDAGGFRRLDSAAPTDPTRVVAPVAASPEWTSADGTTLRVAGPAGAPAPGWRASVGARGAFEGADGADSLRVRETALWREGLRVRWSGGEVRHPLPQGLAPTAHVRVDLPAASVPPLAQARDVEVRLVDAASGAPLAQVLIAVDGHAGMQSTDDGGRITLRGLREPVGLRVDTGAHAPVRALAHPQAGGRLELRLDPLRALDLRLLDPETGAEGNVRSARLLDAAGRELWSAPGEGERIVRVQAKLPTSALAAARLEIHAKGRPVTSVAVPASGDRVALAPRGRAIGLTVRDAARGFPLAGAQVRLRYASGALPGQEHERAGLEDRASTDALGVASLAVPEEEAAVLVVQAPGFAPARRTLGPDDRGSIDVVLERGVSVPVLVQDAHGRPLKGARVVARCILEGVAATVEAATGDDGRARVGPVPAGPVEVLAHAPGHAWGAAAEEAFATMGTVALRLSAGAPLRLMVHDPLGAPLAGVHVTALPADDGPADAQPPEGRPWTTDGQGLLVVEDLSVRAYRLRLSLAGHAEELLHDVRPGAITYLATLVPLAPR